jgi:hypothetical protein
VVSFTPRPLYPQGMSPRYPLDRRLGALQSRSGRFGEEKILDTTGTRTPTPRSSSPQLVAIPTTLSRLLNKMSFAGFEVLKAADMTPSSPVCSPTLRRNVLTSVHIYWTTRRHIQDDDTINYLSIVNTVCVCVRRRKNKEL